MSTADIIVLCLLPVLGYGLARYLNWWIQEPEPPDESPVSSLSSVGPDGIVRPLHAGSSWHSHWNGEGPIGWLPGKECHDCEPRVGAPPARITHIDYEKKVVTIDLFYKNDMHFDDKVRRANGHAG